MGLEMQPPEPKWLSWKETGLLCSVFSSASIGLRFSGGAVRDSLVGRDPKDIDGFAACDEFKLADILNLAGFNTVLTDQKNGLIKASLNKREYDILSLPRYLALHGLKSDDYPIEEQWRLAVQRYDFTINSIMVTPDNKWYDYFGGIRDLNEGILRFIIPDVITARLSPHRISRFFRLHSLYGKKVPDEATTSYIKHNLHYALEEKDSKLTAEINRFFLTPNPYPTLDWAINNYIMQPILGFDIYDRTIYYKLGRIENLLGRQTYPLIRLLSLVLGSDVLPQKIMSNLYAREFLSEDEFLFSVSIIDKIKTFSTSASPQELEALRHQMGQMYGSFIALAWAKDSVMSVDGQGYRSFLPSP